MKIQRNTQIRAGIAAVLALIVGLGIAGLIWTNSSTERELINVYENQDLDIKFSYPQSYFLTEETLATSTSILTGKDNFHHRIMLLKDTAENRNRVASSTGNVGGVDGLITVDIFDRQGERYAADWVRKNDRLANFHLSDHTYETATVGNKEIISYVWKGTYTGNTIALIHEGKIFLLTVASIDNASRFNKDFVTILGTMEFI